MSECNNDPLERETAAELLAEALRERGYDGLFCPDKLCSCVLDNLMPCDCIANISSCHPGYLHPRHAWLRTNDERCPVHDEPYWCVNGDDGPSWQRRWRQGSPRAENPQEAAKDLAAAREEVALWKRRCRQGSLGGGGSHWEGCWLSHIDCAQTKIEELQALLHGWQKQQRTGDDG